MVGWRPASVLGCFRGGRAGRTLAGVASRFPAMVYSLNIDAEVRAARRGRGTRGRRPARRNEIARSAAGVEALEGRGMLIAGLDPAFGDGGRSRVDVADMADSAAAVHRLPDGKILLAGSATWGVEANLHPLQRAFVARLTADGALDATFGNAGVSTYPTPAGDGGPVVEDVTSLAVGADGRIFVGGTTRARFLPPPMFNVTAPWEDDPQWAVAAFTADGAADVSFGHDGVAAVELLDQPDGGFPAVETIDALAVQGDGKLLAVGALRQNGAHETDVAAVRFNADGSIDGAFGTPRLQLANDLTSSAARTAVAVQGDGKVVLAGRTWDQTSGVFAVARYNRDGTPDATFGT